MGREYSKSVLPTDLTSPDPSIICDERWLLPGACQRWLDETSGVTIAHPIPISASFKGIGGARIKMNTTVTANDFATFNRLFRPSKNRFTEVSFEIYMPAGGSTASTVILLVTDDDESYTRDIRIKFDSTNDVWQLWNSANAYTTVKDATHTTDPTGRATPVKLVYDRFNNTFVSMQIGTSIVDPTGVTMDAVANANNPNQQVQLEFELTSTNTTGKTLDIFYLLMREVASA